MNPIEHVWDQTDVWIRGIEGPAFIVPALWCAALQAWASVRTRRARTLVESMPRHVHALSAARDGHIWYKWYGDMAVSMFARCTKIWSDAILFFPDAAIRMCCFSTVGLSLHYSLLLYQLQSQLEIGVSNLYNNKIDWGPTSLS